MERKVFDAKKIGGYKDAPVRGSEPLVLTDIRTFQQEKRYDVKKKRSNYGKKSFVFSSPPYFCNRNRAVFLKPDDSGDIYSAHSKGIPCNSWSCPNCRIWKAKKLRQELIDIIRLNELDHLLTLTLDPSSIPSEYLGEINSTGKYITYLFNRYIGTLKSKMKKPIKYVWVKEFQKNGNAHLHILLSTFLPIKYLRSEWVRIGGGHVMDIQQVKNIEAVAVYVTRYLTKMANTSENFLVGERRYSISHSCLRPPKLSVPKSISTIELMKRLPADKFFLVYNLLRSDAPEEEIILAPHQEKLKL